MRYIGDIYRPPSEAYSLLIQATVGCSHNACTFCKLYKNKKFFIRPLTDILEDLTAAREYYSHVEKIFITDGDALTIPTADWLLILQKIQQLFPECRQVSAYATAKNILAKSLTELRQLQAMGLKMVYVGLESGSDEILQDINKGVTAAEMIAAGQKIKEAAVQLSVTMISGLGGKEKWQLHADQSAQVINGMDPDFLGLLTLTVNPGTVMYQQIQQGQLTLLSPYEILRETQRFIQGLQLSNCVIRSNHASNHFQIAAVLNKEKNSILTEIDQCLHSMELSQARVASKDSHKGKQLF